MRYEQSKGTTMTTVIGEFESRRHAENAIEELARRGVDTDRIGVLWRDESVSEPEQITKVEYRDHHESTGAEAGKGAVGGAIGGSATGAGTVLLASAGVALLPGIGAVLAAGTAAAAAGAAAVGAAGGAATGGLIGALIGASDNGATKVESTDQRYRKRLERQGVIVTIDSDAGQEDATIESLEETGAEHVAVLESA
jgi:hypothetical protein